MSEEITNKIVFIVEWLAIPFLYCILLFLFFFLFVRPLFAFLFDPQRISSKKVLDEKKIMTDAVSELNNVVDFEDLTIDPAEKIPDFITDDKKLAKLASSNPEKGKDLVKKWLNADK